jgi:hypothetical protein
MEHKDQWGDTWFIKPAPPSDTESMRFKCTCGELVEIANMSNVDGALEIRFYPHDCGELA